MTLYAFIAGFGFGAAFVGLVWWIASGPGWSDLQREIDRERSD